MEKQALNFRITKSIIFTNYFDIDTTFLVNDALLEILSSISGVEYASKDPFRKYKINVCYAPLFNEMELMMAISQKIREFIEE